MTLLGSTLAYCPECGTTEHARIVAKEGGVFMERLCPHKGPASVKIVSDHRWYLDRAKESHKINRIPAPTPSRNGCPFDCGPCQWHTGGIHLPVFSITNDCNLSCPICFTYNRPDKKYYKSVEETETIIRGILERSGGVQLINLTGGEPTLHPDLFEILAACRHEGIGRITMNTNGLRIAREKGFAEKLKETGVQLVLSLDTFNPEKSRIIHGVDITATKRETLDILERLDIPTTILAVCIKGVNEEDVADIAQTYLKKKFVRSVTIQNMTFTGKNGSTFEPRDHLTIDDVEGILASCGEIARTDFFPLSSYHPLCYSVAYYIVVDDTMISLSRILDRETLKRMSDNRYFLEPDESISRPFLDGVNRLWAELDDDRVISALRKKIETLFPAGGSLSNSDRRRDAERFIKTVYIHPHMDEDNFDIDRVSRCGDLVPDESGRMIPACSYNLLYRRQDPRFWVEKSVERR
jgi:uncharacterized radical SAM superfamily Fe-S cluster-containing enzyme